MSFLVRVKFAVSDAEGGCLSKIEGQRSERLRVFSSDLESKPKGNVWLSYSAHTTNGKAKTATSRKPCRDETFIATSAPENGW